MDSSTRAVIAFIASLCIGALLTLIVTVSCNYWAPRSTHYEWIASDDDVAFWRANAPAGIDGPPAQSTTQFGCGIDSTFALSERRMNGAPFPDNWVSLRAGWPLRCLEGTRWLDVDQSTVHDIGIFETGTPWGSKIRIVPYRPLWWGLFANSLVYGAFALGVALMLRCMRARRRMAQGLCALCAHQLAGSSVCPECGAAAFSEFARRAGRIRR